ncbi:MAG TPA: hypothetical protein VN783_12405 [Thermoanaerobaculia bacterium]|nr:hypothetical protein [Thermoanaerobaculia bacterium]
MLESLRKAVAIPHVPISLLLSVATVGSFLVLLAQDAVHPIVIYALELYLTF